MNQICKLCNLEFPLSADYFHKSKSFKSGFITTCKKCANKQLFQRRRGAKFPKIKLSKEDINKLPRFCPGCKTSYPASSDFFYNNKTTPSGLNCYCKQCSNTYKKNRQIEGKCKACREPKLENSCYCEKHYFMRMASNELGDSKQWEYLRDLWLKQDKKCVYTGEELIIGKNMSLDHIIPKSRDKSLKNSIENVQWVTWLVNRIKYSLNHEEFVTLCHNVSSRFKSKDVLLPLLNYENKKKNF